LSTEEKRACRASINNQKSEEGGQAAHRNPMKYPELVLKFVDSFANLKKIQKNYSELFQTLIV
jgi:hypothetical protein